MVSDVRGVCACLHGRTPVSPKVIGDFSAICYLTLRDVSRMHTGSRPIGLIESDWGGTPVQAWTPPEGLAACGLPLHNCTTEPHGNCTDYPSKLYNHMVQPFVGFGLRAILWYATLRCAVLCSDVIWSDVLPVSLCVRAAPRFVGPFVLTAGTKAKPTVTKAFR